MKFNKQVFLICDLSAQKESQVSKMAENCILSKLCFLFSSKQHFLGKIVGFTLCCYIFQVLVAFKVRLNDVDIWFLF